MWNVLKWVLAVLFAGFIGQFGRSLALRLIERKRRRRALQLQEAVPDPTAVKVERDRLEALAKIEKKRAKAEVKRMKKSEGSNDESNG